MKLVLVAVVTAVAVIVYRSRHGVEVWHTIEDRPA
ncbi:hypothetical protein SAMN04488581_4443 [Mycolicibacterium neoaurum]|uniref:Uncharacterized protein n=2 Tax=Mycolicibacterium neoaurum TaxID=1795 RepID=V5X6L7_MYCNE|nr:hypothetical protein FBY28_2819 [Arthrobacter sp. SLBN-53]CDQ42263.1 hypothetical protein BN1047_00114 [Mycolicibacterium neoaurum]SDE64704.1 hypothetical protein SAMN04488581_4443 [Mycolicibacterium neoaurum]